MAAVVAASTAAAMAAWCAAWTAAWFAAALVRLVTAPASAAALEEQIRCLRSEDFKEAGLAMAEGRSPQWQGR